MKHSFEHPGSDDLNNLDSKLQAIRENEVASLRVTLDRENEAIDGDGRILQEVMLRFQPIIDQLVKEITSHLEELRRQSEVPNAKSSSEDPSEERPLEQKFAKTRLTVAEIAEPLKEALGESLRMANVEARRRFQDATETTKLEAIIQVERAARMYFQLLGLPARGHEEIKNAYGRLTPKQQAFVDNIAANIASNVVWAAAVGTIGLAWALLS